MTTTNLSATIDTFGDLKADSAALELQIQALKDSLADLEKGAYEGERYRLNVIVANVERTDWKAMCEQLKRAMIDNANSMDDLKAINKQWQDMTTSHTTITEQRSYRVGARNGKKVAA